MFMSMPFRHRSRVVCKNCKSAMHVSLITTVRFISARQKKEMESAEEVVDERDYLAKMYPSSDVLFEFCF